jgi:replicative DNA helicase
MTNDQDFPPDADTAPPFDLEAERAVLGSMILSDRAIEEVAEILQPEHFYRPIHETTYRALLDLHTAGQAHDPIALTNKLERDGDLTKCGGHSYPFTLVQAVPTLAHAEYYAGIVRTKAVLRKIRAAGTGMVGDVNDRQRDPDEILQRAYDTLEGLTALTDTGDQDLSIGADIMETVAEVVDIRENGPTLGLLTGFLDFDALTGGLLPGQFILIAARPAMGKSVLAGDIARTTAIRNDISTVFFSLEMGRKELEKRFLAAQASYPLHWMKTKGPLDDGKIADLIVAKHRNGPTATITVAFQGHYARFVDMAAT